MRLSLIAGALVAAPVLTDVMPRIVWTILLMLNAVLATVLGVGYVIFRKQEPAGYFSEALGKFTNAYYALSTSTPWTRSLGEPAPPQPRPAEAGSWPLQQPAFQPRQQDTRAASPGPLRVATDLDLTPAPVTVPQQARQRSGGQRGRHVAA
jgi:hypothetical protein